MKDQGYPHEESCGTSWMLWLKQLFGNIFRQSLLDQLNSKINEEEIEELSTSEDDEQALIFPFCQEPELLGTLFKYASRSVFTLSATCEIFKKYIIEHPICKRDFRLLKEIFNLAQDTKFDVYDTRRYRPETEPTEMTDTESKCLRLIAEFLPKEAYKITPSNKVYEQNADYAKHQQKLAIVLAGIDPKSALKVVASMNEEKFPVQTFCAVAAIYEKNPSLCDQEKVFAMAEEAYLGRITVERFNWSEGGPGQKACSITNPQFYVNLTELCEAFIRINSLHAKKILRDIRLAYLSLPEFKDIAARSLVKMINRIGIAQLPEMKLDLTLLNLVRIPIAPHNIFPFQSFAIIAKTLVVLNQELAIEALASALDQATKLEGQAKVKLLTDIAEAYAEFDQEKAIEVAKEVLTEIDVLYDWDNLYPEDYRLHRHDIFEYLRRVTRILLLSDREYTIHALKQNTEQVRLMDEKIISRHLTIHPLDTNTFLSLDHFPTKLFMGALEIYPQKASEMVNTAVEWARTTTVQLGTDVDLLKLSQILASSYPDQALEVANMIREYNRKCEALFTIVSKGSSLNDLD